MAFKDLQGALRRYNSESIPCAQTNTLCESGSIADELSDRYITCWAKEMSSNPLMALTIWLMYAEGLRISEILKINGKDITRSYNIRIKSSKGSNDRLINAGLHSAFLKNYAGKDVNIYKDYNRFYFYRELRKRGLSYRFEGNKHSSVTHLGRHLFALDNKKIADSEMSVSKMLGHKNELNQKYYVKEK